MFSQSQSACQVGMSFAFVASNAGTASIFTGTAWSTLNLNVASLTREILESFLTAQGPHLIIFSQVKLKFSYLHMLAIIECVLIRMSQTIQIWWDWVHLTLLPPCLQSLLEQIFEFSSNWVWASRLERIWFVAKCDCRNNSVNFSENKRLPKYQLELSSQSKMQQEWSEEERIYPSEGKQEG